MWKDAVEKWRFQQCLDAWQVSEFLFGDGFAISGGDNWRLRRRAVGPSLHRVYLATMVSRVFGPSAQHLVNKLEVRGVMCGVALTGLLHCACGATCWTQL
jgi:hypothetical protein